MTASPGNQPADNTTNSAKTGGDPSKNAGASSASTTIARTTQANTTRPENEPLTPASLDQDWISPRFGEHRDLIDTVAMLAERGVGFVSLQESIDTTTPGGRLVFHVFAALAEFERDLIRERTNAGLAAARARGRKGGRPSVMTPDKLAVAREMYASGEHTAAAIAAVLGVSRASVYRHRAPPNRPSATGDAAAA